MSSADRSDSGISQPVSESNAGQASHDAKNRRRGLGRGLGALIVNTEHAPAPGFDESDAAREDAAHQPGYRLIAPDNILPNPRQPRAHFDQDALDELAASIRAHGIIQPLVITANPLEPGRYWLIAGERRWRAAQLARLESVPAIVREASPLQLVEWALVENLQRADLNPLEEAAAYQTLVEEFALTQAEIGERVGKSRSAVANTLRLLQLPPEVQAAINSAAISAGHARALLALPDHAAMCQALTQITARDLSVRQTEELVKQLLTPPPVVPEPVDEPDAHDEAAAFYTHLEQRFREALGTRVSLSRGRDGSGKLIVHFFDEEDLASLYQLIVGDVDEEAA